MDSTSYHSERCRDCKERVRQLLTAIYGECQLNQAFSWPTRPQHYSGTSMGYALEEIQQHLNQLRGYTDYIKAEWMPPCDYYLPTAAFIVEFDESQHFTEPRLLALEHYPRGWDIGFSITRWIQLCQQINAKDDDPPDRDERRAWYDTLRDLLPTFHGMKPTVRIYADDFRWCSLSNESGKDLGTFRSLVKHLPAQVKIGPLG